MPVEVDIGLFWRRRAVGGVKWGRSLEELESQEGQTHYLPFMSICWATDLFSSLLSVSFLSLLLYLLVWGLAGSSLQSKTETASSAVSGEAAGGCLRSVRGGSGS